MKILAPIDRITNHISKEMEDMAIEKGDGKGVIGNAREWMEIEMTEIEAMATNGDEAPNI